MNNNSEWITDREPSAWDADCNPYVWVTNKEGDVQPIVPPVPYVKPSRFEIYGAVGGWQVWGVRDNNGFDIIGFISRDHAKWAVEQIEKVMP